MKKLIEGEIVEKFRSMSQIGDTIYLLSLQGNELWAVDMNTGILQKKTELSAKKSKCAVYREVIRDRDRLIFVPGCVNDICIYDISTDVMWKIELPEIKFPYTLGNKFSNAFCVDSRIFFLPFCSSDMLVVDTKCWELSVHKILDTEENWIGGELSSGGYILHRDKCYIASARSNEILEIDINTYKVRRYRLGNEDTWYGSISFDGKNIWLTGGKNTITKWDMIRNIVEEYDYPEYFVKKQGGYPFLSSFQWQDKIILIPRCANMFVIINTETNNINGIQSGYEEISFLLDGNKNQAVLYDNTRWKLFFTDRNHTKAVQIKMESYIKYWIYEVVNNKVGDKGFIDYKQSLCGNKIYSRCKEVYL